MRQLTDLHIFLYAAKFRQAESIELQSHYLQILIEYGHEVKDLIDDPENISEEELLYIKLKEII